MTGNQKLAIFAGISLASLVVGAVWLNDEETWIGGALLVFGFIGSVISGVSYRNKQKFFPYLTQTIGRQIVEMTEGCRQLLANFQWMEQILYHQI